MNKNPEKICVDKDVFYLTQDKKICWKDIKHFQFEDDDISQIGYDDGFTSENNSWDSHYFAVVTRPTLETDAEHAKRLQDVYREKERLQELRYQTYLRLKDEFETNS